MPFLLLWKPLEDPLEEERAIHSSILAWEIPRTEEPGGLQTMGCQRVGQDFVTKQQPGSVVKNPSANAGDARDACLIPGLGRSSGEGNGNPLRYSCLENLMNTGA